MLLRGVEPRGKSHEVMGSWIVSSGLIFVGIAVGLSQSTPQQRSFEVASVRPSQRIVGPDANNQFSFTPIGIRARNVTVRHLVAEAYRLQLNQVLGPNWLDQIEYDIEAQASGHVTKEQIALSLRVLLSERFKLASHRETRLLRLYELVTAKGGPNIQPVKSGDNPATATGFHFHGEMRQFADLLAIQLNIPIADDPGRPGRASGPPLPVLDKTGLTGVFDFEAGIKPELGVDMFTLWQRILTEKLGLRLISRKGNLEVLVIDSGQKVPAAN